MKRLILITCLIFSFIISATAYANLYFPHVDTNNGWETEIAAINTSSTQTASGSLNAYSSQGDLIESMPITLNPYGRRQIIVSQEFQNPGSISYLIFNSDPDTAVGYTKLYKEGIYRAAVPAERDINTSDIYISHIASDDDWWTMISLLNTTNTQKTITLTFSTGETQDVIIPVNGSNTFTIRDLFGEPKENIKSAVITNAQGIIGLELFGSTDESAYNYLSGILLKDDTTQTIYYPHIDSNYIDSSSYWWTGIVAYSPPEYSSNITVTAYREDGAALITTDPITIDANGKYIGSVAGLDLPYGTAWLKIDSTNPITGFELFGTHNGNQLGGYTGVNISGKEGVFAKIEKQGWTGIAFVNIGATQASITLTAYDDNGNTIATKEVTLASYAKQVEQPMNIFTQDISSATYITYSSDKDIVGFQLNGTLDEMMLDGMEGIAGVPGTPPDPNDVDDDGDGYTENQGDCNDTDAAINPGVAEVPGDGIDNNCNGQVDEEGEECPLEVTYWAPTGSVLSPNLKPTFTATFRSSCGANIDVSSIVMLLDGAPVPDPTITGSGSEVIVTYTPSYSLANQTEYEITVTAQDVNGNVGEKTWTIYLYDY